MPETLLDIFRMLASFAPRRSSLADAPWDSYVDWAIGQGLGPLASYNLEFRLAGADAPEWVRDRLLSIYQGSLNDNVMKMVNFRRAISGLSGCRLILLGGASFLESVYPHLAFRPIPDIELLVPDQDVSLVIGHLSKSDFVKKTNIEPTATTILSDGRTEIVIYRALWKRGEPHLQGIVERASPLPIYGPATFQMRLEDALLSICILQSHEAYDIPMITFVDLRELVTGTRSGSGNYCRPVEANELRDRAKLWGQEKALYASLAVLERLFPEVAETALVLKPQLNAAIRTMIDNLVVAPASEVGRAKTYRLNSEIRRLLAAR